MPLSFNHDGSGTTGGKQLITVDAKAVLVEHVLNCETALTTHSALAGIGVARSIRCVMMWMKWTREWLGLPPLYPSTKSDRYCGEVVKWIMRHGFPSRQQILEGWSPAKPRDDAREQGRFETGIKPPPGGEAGRRSSNPGYPPGHD